MASPNKKKHEELHDSNDEEEEEEVEEEDDEESTIIDKKRGQYPIWRPEHNYEYKPLNFDYEPNFIQVMFDDDIYDDILALCLFFFFFLYVFNDRERSYY